MMPDAMLAAIPIAFVSCVASVASAAPTPAAAAIAPNTAVGWNPAWCTRLGATWHRRHMISQPTAMPSPTALPDRPMLLGGRENGGHDDGAGVRRSAFVRVVEIVAMRRGAVAQRGHPRTAAARHDRSPCKSPGSSVAASVARM